ncbi:MAG: hypothetical protein OEY85_07800 [Rhodospirillales bacterium]|nr:hypothetical protein [Rhodospirillales bacterium]
MTHKFRHSFAFLIAIIWVVGTQPAAATGHSPEPFFGEYIGQSISSPESGLSNRDLSVSIGPTKNGFSVKWTTVTHRSNGDTKRKTYEISFLGTGRSNIYASAMKKNKFGAQVPLDPLKGEPYVWAKITGKTLTVNALLINDDGEYEMQVYDRTLTDQGMELRFSRIRNEKILKTITGSLRRIKN